MSNSETDNVHSDTVESQRRSDPIGGPWIKMRSEMWPAGTSEYVLENASPAWETQLIDKLTSLYEEHLHQVDEVNRRKEQEYHKEMASGKGFGYQFLLTLSYRGLTGGAVSYYYPQNGEPSLHGPTKVLKFRHELSRFTHQRPMPKQFAIDEYPAISTLSIDQQKTVGAISWIIDWFCYCITGTFDKIVMVTSLQMEMLAIPGAGVVPVPKSLLHGMKISTGGPKIAKALPPNRGQSRVPGRPETRGSTKQEQLGRRPFDDEVTEPVPPPPPEPFPLGETVSAKRAFRELFIPAYNRGQKVIWRMLRIRKDNVGQDLVDEIMRTLIMLGEQSGLKVRVRDSGNVEGSGNVSFRTEPGYLTVDRQLLSRPDALWEEAFHDIAAIYLFRQGTGHWPTAKNLHLVRNGLGSAKFASGETMRLNYLSQFESFAESPASTLRIFGLAPPLPKSNK